MCHRKEEMTFMGLEVGGRGRKMTEVTAMSHTLQISHAGTGLLGCVLTPGTFTPNRLLNDLLLGLPRYRSFTILWGHQTRKCE